MIQYSPGQNTRNLEIVDEDNTGPCYYQYQTIDGAWIIQKKTTIDGTSGIYQYRYATSGNNASYPVVSAAWSARASLTYSYLNQVTP